MHAPFRYSKVTQRVLKALERSKHTGLPSTWALKHLGTQALETLGHFKGTWAVKELEFFEGHLGTQDTIFPDPRNTIVLNNAV